MPSRWRATRQGRIDPRWRDRRFTGQKAFAAWAALLRNAGETVEDRHHANMIGNLRWNRTAAVAYLREVAGRRSGEAAAALRDATASYESVLAQLSQMSSSGLAGGMEARRRLADQVDRIAAAELQAAGHVERALRALGQVAPGSANQAPQRRVLDGVRKVAYHTDKWRFTPFCNALDACLQYLGEPEQYDYLMCTSGAAFRMKWTAKAWDGGNSDILGMAEHTLEPMRRAFRSAGYQMLPVAKAQPDNWAEDLIHDEAVRLGGELTDEAGFRRRIIDSIDNGRPVIAFGVIGPPEACVITGYDEKGDVLLGWNVFQDDEKAEKEPSGFFRVRDWYPKTRGLLLVGEKVAKPDQKTMDTEALKWALQVLRTPQVRGSAAGPAAYDAWAADMLGDEYFPKGRKDVLGARLICHWDSMAVTAFRGGNGVHAVPDVRGRTAARHGRAAPRRGDLPGERGRSPRRGARRRGADGEAGRPGGAPPGRRLDPARARHARRGRRPHRDGPAGGRCAACGHPAPRAASDRRGQGPQQARRAGRRAQDRLRHGGRQRGDDAVPRVPEGVPGVHGRRPGLRAHRRQVPA